MQFIAMDIGASGTRYVSDPGKISIVPNNMIFLDKNITVNLEPFNDEIESALDVCIESSHKSTYFPTRALVGSLATRRSGTNIRPSVMSSKHDQKVNYVSIILATAISLVKQDLNNVTIPLYIALPPSEAQSAKAKVREELMGTFTVEFSKIGKTVVFTVGSVECFEESFLAMISYFFNMNGSVRDSSKKYSSGNVLSMDIGASTTDLAITTDRRYIEKSGQTYRNGGNVARDILIDLVRTEYSFDLPSEYADIAMAEGRMQMGNNYVDVSELVKEAKKQFAASIVEQIQSYFRKVNIPIQSIRAIIVSGGGSMRSEYVDPEGNVLVTSEAMSYYITEELNNICSGVEVEAHSDNPRLANITGLYIRAMIDIRKKAKAAGSDSQEST